METRIKTASGLNVLLGIWIFFSPWIFGYSANYAALWSSIVVGVVVAALAATRALSPDTSPALSWIDLLLGVWVIATPWIFGYQANVNAMWDKVIAGIIVVILAAISGSAGTVAPPTMTAARH